MLGCPKVFGRCRWNLKGCHGALVCKCIPTPSWQAARGAILHLFKLGALEEGDSVIITSGDYMELHGATNTLRLLKVGPAGRAEGLGEL